MTIGLTDTIKEFVSWSDTLVRFIVPRFSESTWHYLWRDGAQSGGTTFTLKVRPPRIDSLYPVRLHPGDTLTIVGGNFYRQDDGHGSYRPTGVQMYVGPSTSLINGYVWDERLVLWSDSLVKLVVPDWAMSGNVFMVCGSDTSARFPVVVAPTMRSIRTIKVEASLFDLTEASPLDTATYVSSEVVQFPGVPTQEGSDGTYRLVFDSTYRIESGANESEKHMLGEANFVFDADSNLLRTLTISWTETFTNPQQVQPSVKTRVIAVRDIPLITSNANTGSQSYSGSLSFVLTGKGACDNVTELSSDQGYFVLQSWGCNDKSILRISMSYLR